MSRTPAALLLLLTLVLIASSCTVSGSAPPFEGADPAATIEPEPPPDADAAANAIEPMEAPVMAPGVLAGRRVCLDPGHDAYWVPGAAGRDRAGRLSIHPTAGVPLNEHELTLEVASRLQALLEAGGAAVCVTRRPRAEGGSLQLEPYDYSGDGRVRRGFTEDTAEVVQPRIDWANGFGAELLVSIHFNGLDDRRVYGSEVYFTDGGPRRDEGRRLATALLDGLLAEMRGAGLPALSRGVRSDAYQRYSVEETRRLIANNAAAVRANGRDPSNCGECMRLLTLGNNPMSRQMGSYLAALVEVEFLSNPDVVETFILRADSFDVIARGLLHGIEAFYVTQ